MTEPTESESKGHSWTREPRLSFSFLFSHVFLVKRIFGFQLQAELDSFCDAHISIREEFAQIEIGKPDIKLKQLIWTLDFFIAYCGFATQTPNICSIWSLDKLNVVNIF